MKKLFFLIGVIPNVFGNECFVDPYMWGAGNGWRDCIELRGFVDNNIPDIYIKDRDSGARLRDEIVDYPVMNAPRREEQKLSSRYEEKEAYPWHHVDWQGYVNYDSSDDDNSDDNYGNEYGAYNPSVNIDFKKSKKIDTPYTDFEMEKKDLKAPAVKGRAVDLIKDRAAEYRKAVANAVGLEIKEQYSDPMQKCTEKRTTRYERVHRYIEEDLDPDDGFILILDFSKWMAFYTGNGPYPGDL